MSNHNPNQTSVVKPLLKSCHVSEIRGKRVAIDGYCWLHKAIYGCCVELCNGEKSQAWISYCLSYLDVLLRNGVLVTMVFDGANLPMKALTESDRENNRQTNLQRARDLMRSGDKDAARNFFARAVDITPAMAAELIQVIKQSRQGVDCIVAPYEADAQLAYLSANNLVDCVVTEDSDTIPYGCKDTIFKLERDGTCQRLILSDLYSQNIDKFDLRNFNEEMVLTMCILSGCDYLDSVKGMGLKTSYKQVVKHRTASNVLKSLRLAGQLPIVPAANPSENDPNTSNTLSRLLQYELDFYQAILTFNHQVVFDPITRKSVYRTPLNRDRFPESLLEIWWPSASDPPSLPFLGTLLDDDIAQGIADGIVDPITKKPFQSMLPPQTVSMTSAQSFPNQMVRIPQQRNQLANNSTSSVAAPTYGKPQPWSANSKGSNKPSLNHLHVLTPALQPNMLTKSATISSLKHYQSMAKPNLYPPPTSTSTIASSITKSYFTSSSLRRYDSSSSVGQQMSSSSSAKNVLSSSRPTNGTSIASYFKAPTKVSNAQVAAKSINPVTQYSASSVAGVSETVEEDGMIDLSFEDDDIDAIEIGDNLKGVIHSQKLASSEGVSQVSFVDIYDATIITPEKITDFQSTPTQSSTSVRSQVVTSQVNTQQIVKNSGSSNSSVVKVANGQRISKFFNLPKVANKSTSSSSNDVVVNLETADRGIAFAIVFANQSTLTTTSSSRGMDDSVEISMTRRARQFGEEDQLADRLLGDSKTCSTAEDLSSPLPIKNHSSTVSMYTHQANIDLYGDCCSQEPDTVETTQNVNHDDVSNKSDATMQQTSLKRPSFIAFTAQQTSLERLQKRRVSEAKDQLSCLDSADSINLHEEGNSFDNSKVNCGGYEEGLSLSPPLPSNLLPSHVPIAVTNSNSLSNGNKGIFSKFAFRT